LQAKAGLVKAMRSIWAGAISFGLVVIPVKLYAAAEQRDITFRQVHRKDGARIQFRRFCTRAGGEVSMPMSPRVTSCPPATWWC
jgi:non-homologous end joining protein Ku